MSVFYYNNIPEHFIKKLRAVRDSADNLWNVLTLIEAINSFPDKTRTGDRDNFNIAVFTKDLHRFLVKTDSQYFSMTNPFQVSIGDRIISFNCDELREPVDGRFIAIMRNAITTLQTSSYANDALVLSFNEQFGLDFIEASNYADIFAHLLSQDHGYFRFDNDPDNENGDIHPRYHFDVFFKNTCSIKLGYHKVAELECFLSLIDKNEPKQYLVESKK